MNYTKLALLGLQLEQLIDDSDENGLIDIQKMEELLSVAYDADTVKQIVTQITQGRIPDKLLESLTKLDSDQQKLVGQFVNRLVHKLEAKSNG